MSNRYKSESKKSKESKESKKSNRNKDKKNNFDIDNYVKNRIDVLLEKNIPETIDTLVLSGGSIKGMAQLGALHYMESIGTLKNIKTIAGTSVGSIIGTMIIIGYRPVEIYHFFMNTDMKSFTKINAYNFFNKLGLDDGKRFTLVTKKFFKAKSVSPKITFKQLYEKTKIKIIITGACINDKKTHYFSHETEPNMRVIDALRISASIPVMFTPRKYKSKVFVDGGCTDNYPISQFTHKLNNVIGIFVSEEREIVDKITSIESYLMNTMSCLREGMDTNAYRGYEERTMVIKCISGEDKNHISMMFDQGYRTALLFFKELEFKEE
jgi:predicted acylesterase/phospholipase RssA